MIAHVRLMILLLRKSEVGSRGPVIEGTDRQEETIAYSVVPT